MKKVVRSLALVVCGFIFLSLTGCDSEETVVTRELTIGLMASVDAFPIVIAHHNGYFAEEGLEVTLIPFSNAANRDAALQAGELDGTTADLVGTGLFIEAGLPMRATGGTGGRFTLVANEGFNSVADLAGATVVISENTAIDFVLDTMVARSGFELTHVERSVVPSIPERMELLRAGLVTAAVLPEPWASIAIHDGLYGIMNTVEMDFVPFIQAFTDEVIDNRPEDIRAFYRAYNRAIDFINETPLEDYFYIMVEVINFPEHVADFLILPTFTHNRLPADDVLAAATQWLIERGLVSETMTPADLVSPVAFE